MITHDTDVGARGGRAGEPAGAAQSPQGGEADAAWLERLLAELAGALRQVRVLADVRLDRGRLALRRAIEAAQRELLVWLAVMTAVVSGAVLLAVGLAHGLAAAFGGRPWAGELAAAVLLLGAAASWHLWRRARRERVELEQLRRKYGRIDPQLGDEEPNPTAADGRGMARPNGGTGARQPEARAP